ncbi:MAG: substrate-binding domain-containing protein [Ectothiorhodospiraceae bacterium]|nr:substrate-binding domain-containing protein [Chromatiales bacterium]MCP5154666.1 substrate-binding domain-containing protein [Ectothiorhodospiraceae bacterium]
MSKGSRRQVTLEDVARLAGVSASTVSRSLSMPHMVRASVRESVLWAVSRLGYVPHGAARALARRRNATIGVIIPSLRFTVFADLVESLQAELGAAGYSVLLGHAGSDLRYEADQATALLSRGIDALVLVGNAHDQSLERMATNTGIPVVTTFDYRLDAPYPCVGIDNQAAGRALVDHLLDLGHTRIAALMPDERFNDRAARRLAGVRGALADRGLALHPQHLVLGDGAAEVGRAAMAELLGREPSPSAVVCFSDLVAIGAVVECRARAVSVPGAVSVAGFSGIGLAELTHPAITTVSFSAVDIGREAARLVLDRLDGDGQAPSVEVPHRLEQRASTAAPGP